MKLTAMDINNKEFKRGLRGYSVEEVDEFLRINRDYFENKGYKVYFTNARFNYQNANRMVQPNELMIAIKE